MPASQWLRSATLATDESLLPNRSPPNLLPSSQPTRSTFGLPPGPLVLKLELLQHTGSFKARGAFANLLLRDIPEAGVVAASGGNHGVAVSHAASVLGVPARIYVPGISSAAKIARIRGNGAQLVIAGDTYADALAASREWAAGSGAMAVHAFDQAETILGAGTLATELAGQAPAAVTVLASVGGGGLLAGIAAGYAGQVRVVVGPGQVGAHHQAGPAGRGGQDGVQEVRALLGHARIDTTQVYTTIRPAQLKRAVEFYEEKAVKLLTE